MYYCTVLRSANCAGFQARKLDRHALSQMLRSPTFIILQYDGRLLDQQYFLIHSCSQSPYNRTAGHPFLPLPSLPFVSPFSHGLCPTLTGYCVGFGQTPQFSRAPERTVQRRRHPSQLHALLYRLGTKTSLLSKLLTAMITLFQLPEHL